MDDLVDAIAAVMIGRSAELLSVGVPGLWDVELAPGYSFRDWCATAETDRRRLLFNIATKTEFPDEVGEALKQRFYLSEFTLPESSDSDAGTEARGLGAAFLLNGIGASLLSDSQWRRIRVPLRHLWLEPDGCQGTNTVEALNISQRAQAQELSDILTEQRQAALRTDPLALAQRKNECFPHLFFGLDVDGQIAKLPSGILPALVGKLAILDTASRTWRRDVSMTSPLLPQCHPESQKTMQQFASLRVFRDPCGNPQSYEPHCMLGSAYRIHLRIVHQPRGLEIGYIGVHLPTARDPH